ncbi:LysR family transcriptional regulator [Acetobacterium tundrae]|uniref:LysR family transcriptional regulator n=1 Tax=Acetobacterium tundrae TaxID=132932 RepID=A0ABR6WPV2_9FIRM|nr:LysR family transcriptional regulator [Acetobacterium tundrae]MBC3798175.1 LysR family transcriptional regulator [Acetobacterium tundrae]
MNLNQLYYFKKLAELEHYTQASKELFITQPSLSGSISSLEEELGIALFQHHGRNIKLTKYGKGFYQYVCSALTELEKGIEKAREKSGSYGGVIDLGCIPTLIGDFLPVAINDYLKNVDSKTKFNIFQGMTLDVIEGIESEKYDVGFCSYIENKQNLEFHPIMAQELILLVNNNHPLAEKDSICLKELSGYPLITYRHSLPIGKTISKYLKTNHLKALYAYDDEISIGGVISNTDSAAITAKTPFLYQFSHLKMIKLDIPIDARLIYMVYNKDSYHTLHVNSFVSYVLENECNLPL